MSNLAAQVQNLENRFNELEKLFSMLLPSLNGGQRRKGGHGAKRPSLAEKVMTVINQLSEQLLVIKEVLNGEPGVDCHNHNAEVDNRGATSDRSKQPPHGRQLATQIFRPDESAVVNREDGAHSVRNDSLIQQDQASTVHSLSSDDSDVAGSVETSRETSANTTPELPLPVLPTGAQSVSNFSLSLEEMGEKLVPSVMQFVANRAFCDRISIMGDVEVDWPRLKELIRPPPRKHDLRGVTYSTVQAEGAAGLQLSQSKRFYFPEFSRAIEPSMDECLDYLNQLINDPPNGTIPYYVGPPLHDGPLMSKANSLLHPGHELLKLRPIDGLNSVYWHAGEKGSGTAFHCEDMRLFSVNMVLSGFKLWIKIRPSHTSKFEAFIRNNWPTNKCDQFVRHVAVIVSPEKLRKEKIDFDTVLAGPGDLVLTRSRQYHMVVNMTNNFALAINFLPPGEPVVPKDTLVCPKCGLYSLQYEGIQKVPYAPVDAAQSQPCHEIRRAAPPRKRQITSEALQRQAKRPKRHTTLEAPQALRDLDAVKHQMLRVDKLCKFPSLEGHPPTPTVFSAVAAIWSRPAIDQFCALVRSTRDIRTHSAQIDISGDLHTRIEHRIGRIEASRRRSKFEEFLLRLDQLYLAEEIESSRHGRIRIDTAMIQGILKRTGWSMNKLQQHRRQGDLWRRLCDNNDGLLCFISLEANNPFGTSLDIYAQMTDQDLKMFHQLLDSDYTRSICLAGKAFQNALDSMVADADFFWERRSFAVYTLPEEKLLTSLKPIPSTTENVYDPNKYPDWPRPRGWPNKWSWPMDPTALDPHGRQCDLCDETNCI